MWRVLHRWLLLYYMLMALLYLHGGLWLVLAVSHAASSSSCSCSLHGLLLACMPPAHHVWRGWVQYSYRRCKQETAGRGMLLLAKVMLGQACSSMVWLHDAMSRTRASSSGYSSSRQHPCSACRWVL